jgi:pyruvate kinase
MKMKRRAKIVATIGPASQDEETLGALLEAGVDVARLNFSHGTHADHQAVFNRLRRLSEESGRPVTILQDVQGPKIRTGELAGGKLELIAGQKLSLTTQPVVGNSELVAVDYAGLPECVKPGSRILIDDGNLELVVVSATPQAEGGSVETRVVLGGTLYPHKGVNLPGAHLDVAGLTAKDIQDLKFGLELGVDAVAISFVRQAQDIELVRQTLTQAAPQQRLPLIIAKLERPEALDNLEAIIDAVDGVMVARGDLGVEMLPESVPIAQKRIIELANQKARLVITATQMLESMVHNPRPTRAEASDVANAIFDGSDAVMLSAETAAGLYPVQAVTMMDAIVEQAEGHSAEWGRWNGLPEPASQDDDTYYLTQAACQLAHDRNVTALVVFTESGRTACMLSKERPAAPILACTPNLDTYQRMGLYWGVQPLLVPRARNIEEMLVSVESALLATQLIKPGEQVVLTFGYPLNRAQPSNTALLHTVGAAGV